MIIHHTEQAGLAVKYKIWIREVNSSNLGRRTDHRDWKFSWFSSVFSGKWRVSTYISPIFQNPQWSQNLTRSLDIDSLVQHPSLLYRFIIWDSGNVVLQEHLLRSTLAATPQTCIREVTGLNLGGAPIIVTEFLRGFPQFVQATAG
jgi:hypothetical protein